MKVTSTHRHLLQVFTNFLLFVPLQEVVLPGPLELRFSDCNSRSCRWSFCQYNAVCFAFACGRRQFVRKCNCYTSQRQALAESQCSILGSARYDVNQLWQRMPPSISSSFKPHRAVKLRNLRRFIARARVCNVVWFGIERFAAQSASPAGSICLRSRLAVKEEHGTKLSNTFSLEPSS